ncbi:MAG: hypothetical protein J6M05_01630 [Cardiobacteriaceae bacterium]|nr:hypothetical protein [Cardiobacteriaceae bacterium]
MSKKEQSNFYNILRLQPNATDSEIRRAIEKMRIADRNKTYKLVLDNMEFTLLHPIRRAEYNKSLGLSNFRKANSKAEFVDVNQETVEHRKTQRTTTNSYNQYREMSENSVMSAKNQRKLGRRFSSRKGMRNLIFIVILAVIAVIASKPALDFAMGKQQLATAEQMLYAARDKANNIIKNEKQFPVKMQFDNESYFSISIKPLAREIQLNFNNNASTMLQDKWLRVTYETPPNFSYWKCTYSEDFSSFLKPTNCY